jgi:hypothetical protein
MIYVERNLSPIFGDNPYYDQAKPQPGVPRFWRDSDFSDALMALGAKPYFMVYDGTLNNARLWSNDDGTLMPSIPTTGGPFDWEHRTGNYSNPPTKEQVQACARLALNPQASGCKLPGGVPIIFDIEACKTLNFSAIDPPEKWQAAIDLVGKMAGWVREVNPRSPVLSLGLPLMANVTGPDTPAIVSLDSHYLQALRGQLSGAAVLLYSPMWYPGWLDNPGGWFDAVDAIARDGDRYFDGDTRYAVVSPLRWDFFGDHARDGTPLDIDFWKEQLHYLRERKFEIVVWIGGKSIKQIGRDHLDALRPFIG